MDTKADKRHIRKAGRGGRMAGLDATARDDRAPALPAASHRAWPGNPLGVRALHIGATVYRIHGTNAPETVGQAVSSGCFRLVNDDIIDLCERVPVGTQVVVHHLVRAAIGVRSQLQIM